MFYCEPCGHEWGYPTDKHLPRSSGKCELCVQIAECVDVPKSVLPNIEKAGLWTDIRLAYHVWRGSNLDLPLEPWERLPSELRAMLIHLYAEGMRGAAELADDYGELELRDRIKARANEIVG